MYEYEFFNVLIKITALKGGGVKRRVVNSFQLCVIENQRKIKIKQNIDPRY